MRISLQRPLQILTCLAALTAIACPTHVHHEIKPGKLTPEQEAILIYFKDQKPCESYVELGHIEASSGEEPEPEEKQHDYPTFDAAIGWLKVEAHKRGATAVIVFDRRTTSTSYFLTGLAIRCVLGK